VRITGLDADRRLSRLLDESGRDVSPQSGGLLISRTLAEALGVRPGHDLLVEVLEGRRPVRRVPVVGVVEKFAGFGVWTRDETVHRWMREGNVATGALLAIDPARGDALYRRLMATPRVAAVTRKDASLRTYRETMAETVLRLRLINVLFACVIAAGVVYNTGRIAFAERSRDLASMRVLGFRRGEVSAILLGELAVLAGIGLPVGMLVGRALAALTLRAMETETFRLPVVVAPGTYAVAVSVVLAASLVTALLVRRRVDRMDLVAVLKARE
jgi:putative ABC transport system permease protein